MEHFPKAHRRTLEGRIVNLAEWAWHVIDALRRQATRNPDPRLDTLVEDLTHLVPGRPRHLGPDHLGFAVPLRLRTDAGELRLMTTLSHFAT